MANEKTKVVETACRLRIEDLRVNIGELRSQLNDIRACSAQRKMAIRQGNAIVCRDITVPHHRWTNLTELDFALSTAADNYGARQNLRGIPGDPGGDVECTRCGTWRIQGCPAGHPEPTYTALQYCPTNDCCGEPQAITVTCTPANYELRGCNSPATPNSSGWSACSASCGSVCTPTCHNQVTGAAVSCTLCGQTLSTCAAQTEACTGGSCIPPTGNNCDRCPVVGSPAGGWLLNGICIDYQPLECGNTSTSSSGSACTNPTWQIGEWGACSAGSCGTGSQTRTVSCKCPNGEASTGCDVNLRPTDIRTCDTYTYAFENDWGTCNSDTQIKPCRRCDGVNVACSNCGGECPSQSCDTCQTPGTCFWTCTTGGEVGNFCRFNGGTGPNGMPQSRISCSTRGALHPDSRFGGMRGPTALPAGPGAGPRTVCQPNEVCDEVHARCMPAN